MSKKRVLVDNELATVVLDVFEDAGIGVDIITPKPGLLEPLVKHGDYAALLLQNKTLVPLNVLEARQKSLEVIGIVGDDLSNINLTDASNNGIIIKATEYGNTYEAAHLAMRLMMCMSSKEFRKKKSKGARIFKHINDIVYDECSGFELAFKTIGLIGCGNVAQALAEIVHPYCKSVCGYDNHPRAVYEQFHQRSPLNRPIIDYCQLSTILEQADVISIHTSGTEKVFRDHEIFSAKKKPFLINTARSGSVDEEALLEALQQKRIRGAAFALPVEHIKSGEYPASIEPFLSHKSVVIVPSIGKPEASAHKENSRKLAKAIIEYLLHKDMSLAVNPIDAPMGNKKVRYPIMVERRHTSIPITFF